MHGLDDDERREAYAADITYGTNNEFGFDYLRDNMKFDLADYVQRPFNFAIVDEVDSILIDEARTPLIISGPTEDSTDKYYIIDRIIPLLKKGEVIEVEANTLSGKRKTYTGDYTVDEKAKSATLTEEGVLKVEKLLKVDNLYDPRNMEILHHTQQALRAHALFKRDVDYVVQRQRGAHRRRVHRPPDAGAPLVRRPAPGDRGEGRGEDREREPDPRHHHLPELLPHVRASSPA